MSMPWNRVADLRKIGLIVAAGMVALGAAQALAAKANNLGDCPTDRNAKIRLPKGTYACTCPAVDVKNATITWNLTGTQVYALSKSNFCAAAVHAGALKPDTAGRIKFEIIDSPPLFRGSTQNGITSQASGKDWGAFQFAIGAAPAAPGDLGDCPTDSLVKIRLPKGTYACTCPAVDVKNATVTWNLTGTQVYALSKSDFCAAAVHAGVLKPDTAGSIKFEVIDSPPLFRGSTQNGITSQVSGKKDWGAFQFAIGAAPAAPGDLGDCPTDPLVKIGLDKGTFSCSCPAVDVKSAMVTGTQVYALSKGDICAAAVHAGVLKPDTAGSIKFEVIDSPAAFKGTEQNGIKSDSYEEKDWDAFQFVKVGK